MHLKRHFVKAHATAAEPEAALDLAIDKVEHQVARIKEKRVARSHPRHGNGHSGNGALGRRPTTTTTSDDGDRAARSSRRSGSRPSRWIPSEAALQMDLLGHAFFLFTNTETGHAALLYRRNDGNLGLIETVA